MKQQTWYRQQAQVRSITQLIPEVRARATAEFAKAHQAIILNSMLQRNSQTTYVPRVFTTSFRHTRRHTSTTFITFVPLQRNRQLEIRKSCISLFKKRNRTTSRSRSLKMGFERTRNSPSKGQFVGTRAPVKKKANKVFRAEASSYPPSFNAAIPSAGVISL